jgi:hypothetical protein
MKKPTLPKLIKVTLDIRFKFWSLITAFKTLCARDNKSLMSNFFSLYSICLVSYLFGNLNASTEIPALSYGFHYMLPFLRCFSNDGGSSDLKEFKEILASLNSSETSIKISLRNDESLRQMHEHSTSLKTGFRLNRLCNLLVKKKNSLFHIPHKNFCHNLSEYVRRDSILPIRIWRMDPSFPSNSCSDDDIDNFEVKIIQVLPHIIENLKYFDNDYRSIYYLFTMLKFIADIEECLSPEILLNKSIFYEQLEEILCSTKKILFDILENLFSTPFPKILESSPISHEDLDRIRELKLIDNNKIKAFNLCVQNTGPLVYKCLYHIFPYEGLKDNDSKDWKFKAIISVETAVQEYLATKKNLAYSSQVNLAIAFGGIFDQFSRADMILNEIPLASDDQKSSIKSIFLQREDKTMHLVRPLSIWSLMKTRPRRLPFIFLYYLHKKVKDEAIEFQFLQHYLINDCFQWFNILENTDQYILFIKKEFKFAPLKIPSEDPDFHTFLDIYNSFLSLYYSCVTKNKIPLTFPLYDYSKNSDEEADDRIGRALTDFGRNILQLDYFLRTLPSCYYALGKLSKQLAAFYASQDLLKISPADLYFLKHFWDNYTQLVKKKDPNASSI